MIVRCLSVTSFYIYEPEYEATSWRLLSDLLESIHKKQHVIDMFHFMVFNISAANTCISASW